METSAITETPAPCHWCGFVQQPGESWGFLDGPHGPDYCDHIHEQRRCDSCTRDWWAPGLQPDWDVDGCAKQDCPECVADRGNLPRGCGVRIGSGVRLDENVGTCGADGRLCWSCNQKRLAGMAELDRLANEAGDVARAERAEKGAA